MRIPFAREKRLAFVFALCCAPACGQAPSRVDVDAGLIDGLTAEQELGRLLFEDVNLSEPPGQACASCHDAANAFTGNDHSTLEAVAAGSRPNVFGTRNVPTILYAQLSPRFSFVDDVDPFGHPTKLPVGGQFWDGRASTLEEQAKLPFLEPREMNNADAAQLIAKVRAASYASFFRSVYGAPSLDDSNRAYDLVARAIAAFERSARFAPFTSRFDGYLRGEETLTDQELLGFSLFQDPEKGNCITCHRGDTSSKEPRDWPFTDFGYEALGAPRNIAIPLPGDPGTRDLGLCRAPGLAAKLPAGYDAETLCAQFKVPTLRNVASTAPYMHNGFFTSLRDVVHFYATRSTNPELWYPMDAMGKVVIFDDVPEAYEVNVNDEVPYDRKRGETPRLSDDEIDAIVAFLATLSDR